MKSEGTSCRQGAVERDSVLWDTTLRDSMTGIDVMRVVSRIVMFQYSIFSIANYLQYSCSTAAVRAFTILSNVVL